MASKKGIATFFSIIFLLFINLPTVLLLIDNTNNISVVFPSSEKEKGSEENLDIEVLFSFLKTNNTDLAINSNNNNLIYFDKKYRSPYLNIVYPPPDF